MNEFDYENRLDSRPTLTEERNHVNHWFNRAADLHASAGALSYAMKQDNDKVIAEELGFTSGYSMGMACWPVYHMLCGLALEVIMKAVLIQRKVDYERTHDLEKLVQLLGEV